MQRGLLLRGMTCMPVDQLIETSKLSAMGELHPLLALLPMILFTGALICDLINSFGKSKALIVGHWFVITGLICCMPTIFSGLESARIFGAESDLLVTHRELGIATGIFASCYAGLRISAMIWNLTISSHLYLGMSILLLALISWTADYGVLLSSN